MSGPVMLDPNSPVHPLVQTLRRDLGEKRINRRDFLRSVTLLGVTTSAAYAMADMIEGTASTDQA